MDDSYKRCFPDDLAFLAAPSLKYGRYTLAEDYAVIAKGLSELQLEELGEIGRRIRDNHLAPTIHDLTRGCVNTDDSPGGNVWSMLLLMKEVSRQELGNVDVTGFWPPRQKPDFDWSWVPQQWSYLFKAAEDYAGTYSEDAVWDRIDELSDEERAHMAELAKRCSEQGHHDEILEWYAEGDNGDRPEGLHLESLFLFFDSLGLHFE